MRNLIPLIIVGVGAYMVYTLLARRGFQLPQVDYGKTLNP